METPEASIETRQKYIEAEDPRIRIMALNAITRPKSIARPLLPTDERTAYDEYCADQQLIQKGLEDKDPFVRIAALQAMKAIYDGDVRGAVLVNKTVATDPDYLVRATAINTNIHPAGIPDDIVQMGMEDDDPVVVAATLRAVKRYNHGASLPKRDIIRALTSDNDILVKEALAYCRGGVPHVTFPCDIAETWAYTEDPCIRAAGMAMMDNQGWERYAEELWLGLEEDHIPVVRQQALIGIVHSVKCDCTAEPILLDTLDDPDLRDTMLEVLLNDMPKEQYENWREALEKIVATGEYPQRIAAVRILDKMGHAPIRDRSMTTGCTNVVFGPESLAGTTDEPPTALVRVKIPETASIIEGKNAFGTGYYVSECVVTDSETADGISLAEPGTVLTRNDNYLWVTKN